MKNKIIIILQVLISVMFFRCASINKFVSEVTKYNDKDLHAQGISSQGRIYLGAKEKMERKGQVNLACTVDIIDPNGNKILEPGETITFVATIRNFSLDYTVYPKLRILKYSDDKLKPTVDILFLSALDPGEKTEIKETLTWDMNLTGLKVNYNFYAFDKFFKSSSIKTDFVIPVTM